MRIRKRTGCVDYSRHTRSLDFDLDKLIEGALSRDGDLGNESKAPSELASPALMVQGGPKDGAEIPILKPKITMGSLPGNDIVVEGIGVSERHAEIFRRNDGHYLRDLGVVHPTFVNRRDIGETQYLLHQGDRIQLAYSSVTHEFNGDKHALANLTPIIHFEEQPDNTPGSTTSLHQTKKSNHGTINEQGPEGLGDHQETLEQLNEPEIYEGTVRLTVGIEGQIRMVVSFVTELRLNSRLRMLRMLGNPPENVDIWLALREPVPLIEILDRMEAVTQVSGSPRTTAAQSGQVDILNVQLNTEFGGNSLNHRFQKQIHPSRQQ